MEQNLGITFGLVVRAMGFSKTVTGGISSLRQGEVSQFTVVLEDARRHAIDRMIENAKLLGANAVIAMRFDSSEIGKARAEVVAYGSAVVVTFVGMSEPGGGAPTGRRSLLGDADRERLVALLREHYAAGRLDLDDLRHRVGVVLAAAYAEEAAVVLADLPPAGVPDTPGAGVPDTPGAGRGGSSRGRHAQTRKPQPGWVPTAERFRDPSSGVIMRVWIDPSDESRHYVPDDAPTPW